jgi:hypothetical protein
MKCISCESDIDPKWAHAISINVCPNCGQAIMEEHLKNLLSTLGSTMRELQQYPEQLNDWLFSNYQYVKTDSPLLASYLPKEQVRELSKQIDEQEEQQPQVRKIKIKQSDGSITEEEVIVEKKMSNNRAKEFYDRANNNLGKSGKAARAKVSGASEDPKSAPTDIISKTEHLKTLKHQIEEEAKSGIVNQAQMVAMMETENPDVEVSSEEVAEMQAEISGGDQISSGFSSINGEEEDRMADRAMQINMQMAQRNPANKAKNEAEDLLRIQNAVSSAQSRFGDGGFSRGS